MKCFKHYIITRFNVKVQEWHFDKNKNAIQNNDWLLNRISLFEQFCLPSICAQTNKDFDWLVYFDKDSPSFLKDKINHWQQICENFSPQFSDSFSYEVIAQYLKQNIPQNIDYVLTTRIDNDDAFRCDAVEKIQNAFVPQANTIIDCINGYCYDLNTGVYTEHTMRSNPFISYIESSHSKMYGVYKEEHPNWIGQATFITIRSPRLWFQVIHNRNIVNKQYGIVCFPPKLNKFGLNALPCVDWSYIVKQRCRARYYLFKHKLKIFLYSFIGKRNEVTQ